MLVCCGESLIDMVPEEGVPDAFIARPGGCPYNTAIAAARLGTETRFAGRIGSDFLGEMLFQKLKVNGVGMQLVERSEAGATLAFVHRAPSGDASYAFYNSGAADVSLSARDLPPDLWSAGSKTSEPRFLALGSISLLEEPLGTAMEALARRESGRAIISLDPNIRPGFVKDRAAFMKRLESLIALASIVKASEEDLEYLYPSLEARERCRPLLEAGVSLVLETRGAEGVVARGRDRSLTAKAYSVKIADTIGAGDTFHAAFLHCLDEAGFRTREEIAGLDEDSLARMLSFSQAAAALDCQKVGAEPPFLEEIEAFLEAQS